MLQPVYPIPLYVKVKGKDAAGKLKTASSIVPAALVPVATAITLPPVIAE